MLRRPNDTYYRRDGLIAFALCLLLGSMAAADDAYAQAPQTTYPAANGVNEDPDQGEPQANPPTPPPPRPRLQPPRPPQPLFPDVRPPWATQLEDLRRRLYDEYGLTFGAAYNQLYQHTSATAPTALYDQALGAWAQASMTWTPLDRGGDHEGTLVVRGAFRGSLGDNAVPAQFGVRDIGSIWSNYEFTSWNQGFRIEDLFWEQQLGPAFSFRIGNQGPQSVFNFFRFKDARTGFTSSPLAFNETIPYPTFGLGGSFRWQPVASDPEVYAVGTLNDMNGDPADLGLDWNTFGLGQYFYGLEIGKNWRRDNGEFDLPHRRVLCIRAEHAVPRYVAEHGRRRLQGGRREAGRPRRGLRQLHLQHCGGRRDRGDLVRANGGRRVGVPPAFRCAGRGCRRLHVVPIDPWPAADGRAEEPVWRRDLLEHRCHARLHVFAWGSVHLQPSI